MSFCISSSGPKKNKLLKSEGQYRTAAKENKIPADIITMVNNMEIVTDKNNMVTWVNKAVEDFTGYGLADLAGKTPSSVVMVDVSDIEKLRSYVVHIINSKIAGEFDKEEIIPPPVG